MPEEKEGVWAALSMVRKAKFRKFIVPGECLTVVATLNSIDRYSANGKVKIYVNEELRADADLTFMLISKSKMPNDELEKQREKYWNLLTSFHDKVESLKNG